MEYFYAAVIHDIKNQLTELALRLEKRGDAAQEMSIVMHASRQLTDLLLFQRQKEGRMKANVDSASPTDTLRDLRAEYHELFPQLTLELDDSAAPAFGFYDAALVRLALANAMHNACVHARSQVRLAVAQQDGWLTFSIQDDGEGFSSERLAMEIIEPGTISERGTGLGLFLAHKIAELHELDGRSGRVELANAECGGGLFRLRLP